MYRKIWFVDSNFVISLSIFVYRSYLSDVGSVIYSSDKKSSASHLIPDSFHLVACSVSHVQVQLSPAFKVNLFQPSGKIEYVMQRVDLGDVVCLQERVMMRLERRVTICYYYSKLLLHLIIVKNKDTLMPTNKNSFNEATILLYILLLTD